MNRLTHLLVFFFIIPLSGMRAEVSLEEGIQSHLDKLTSDKLPGMAVLVARDGKIAFQGGFGFAEIANDTRITAETRFRIGSISKQFTAAAILRLCDEGKLSLADPLAKHIPGFPDGVTIRQLLNHTSGIHSYTEKPEFLARVTQPIEPDELIDWFRDDPPDFAPGEGFRYNNSAYFLLGEIVTKVAGKSFAACLEEMFFEPLGMANTGIFQNNSPPERVAHGYAMADKAIAPALDWDMTWAGGAGALYSTVGDLFLWNEALFGGKVLKGETFAEMIRPVDLPEGADGWAYGYGLAISELNRLPVIGHSGGLHGWSSDLIRLPEQQCTVVALANALPPVDGFEPATVTRRIAATFLEDVIAKLPPLEEDPAADKSTYPDFVGRYDYINAVLTVTIESDKLFAQLSGQPRFEIFPSGRDAFFWKVTDAKVEFQRNPKGKVIAARHTQGGVVFTAPRLEAAGLQLSDAELDAILGEYQYAPGIFLTVSRDGQAVFAQLTGQPKFQIHARSATVFEWRVVPAAVTFVKDEAGQVTGAIHSQGGTTTNATKVK
jgi:CubicO group peptidase (beta-lactamase class C family)